jgi:hypothetical protein
MKIKKCFKCGIEMPIDKFYRHSEMADGHLGKCKEGTKKDLIKNRANKLEYYKEYDRKRADLPKRVKARKDYAEKSKLDPIKTKRLAEADKRYGKKYPDKKFAHNSFYNAIRDKKIKRPKLCSLCGAKN